MNEIRNYFSNLSQVKKVIYLVFIVLFILILSITIPSLASYKNNNVTLDVTAWDGNVADSFRRGTGTLEDPYIISNASELAYLSSQLSDNDYEGNYFVLNNDIIINNGTFSYDDTNGLEYNLNNIKYYVKQYTNEYYDNADRRGSPIGNINSFIPLNNFKGNFDGNSFRIYGLYVSQNNEQLGLFTNLRGNVHNLNVENSAIYGGNFTGGIVGTATDAVLNNISYNGVVVGEKKVDKNVNVSIPNKEITLSSVEQSTTIDLSKPSIFGDIVSIKLTGTVTSNGNIHLAINGNEISDDFEVELGTELLSTVEIIGYSDLEETIFLTNLNYIINYQSAITGGIVGAGSNLTLTNVLNKGYIYGDLESAGIVGIAHNCTLSKSYNNGSIYSNNIGAGLIGRIDDGINSISNSYNTGTINASIKGGLISVLSNASLNLTNDFDITSNYMINSINTTNLEVSNCYYVNDEPTSDAMYKERFNYISINDLQNKEFIKTELQFNEFISKEDLLNNQNNVWIYSNNLPTLYTDDINKPITNIHVNAYTWNKLSQELTKYTLTTNLTFSIEGTDNLRPLKQIYYYVHNNETPLTIEEIKNVTWNEYTNYVEISEDGLYIIYAKAIDYNDNIFYLNTDLLSLDRNGPSVEISTSQKTWNKASAELNYLYINNGVDLTIEARDQISNQVSLEYYISNEIVDPIEHAEEFLPYIEPLTINELGTYVIYARAIDESKNTTYVNSDYIVYNGYSLSNFNYGKNIPTMANIYITNKSSISFDATYVDNIMCSNCSHNLVSSVVLPKNTQITLIDNNTHRVYEYSVTENDVNNTNTNYPFTLFKEIGKNSVTNYVESSVINDNYTIIIDFVATDIQTNYDNIYVYLELVNDITRTTIENTKRDFSVYATNDTQDTKAMPYLNIENSFIELNTNATTDIVINTGLNYKYINDNIIYDTTYEDKSIGVSIKLIDALGNVIERQNYKNIAFKIGDKQYYPDSDNITRINLESGINDITKNLTIVTMSDNLFIDAGNYYFDISNYVSYDGLYPTEYFNGQHIPVTISDVNYSDIYGFNVNMNSEDRMINKGEDKNITFNLLESGIISSPSIRVSLYKRDELKVQNQHYTLLDLKDYTTSNLDAYSDKVYSVPINELSYNWNNENQETFTINFITTDLDKTGYKFVFELYDGNRKLSTIEKKFLIK